MSVSHELEDCSVLIVEDEFYVAFDLKKTLESFGAKVIGPFGDVEGASGSLETERPDCAILDVNLSGQSCYDLARKLRERQLPFAFYTGYDQMMLPPEFADVDRLEKPIDGELLKVAVRRLCREASEMDRRKE